MGAIGSKFGRDVEAKLAAEYGGTDFYVPATEFGANWSKLRSIVGDAIARQIVAEFGGGNVYIPDIIDRRELAREIRRRIDAGETVGKIARTTFLRVRITERTIRRILRRYS